MFILVRKFDIFSLRASYKLNKLFGIEYIVRRFLKMSNTFIYRANVDVEFRCKFIIMNTC